MTLLVVGGALAYFLWGNRLLVREGTPTGHFQAPPSSGAPDYTKPENWIASADIPDNPSHWRPSNDSADGTTSTETHVFYIHPTTFLRRDAWNAALRSDPETEFRTKLFVQSQASAFSDEGVVWAPRYRQAAYGAFLLKSEDAQKALDLAYSDVTAAFDEFLKRNPSGPIILAGHSQGALHLSRLLRDRAPQLKGRLVAAYVVGWPLSVTADLPPMRLSACSMPEQTDCVLSWQSFAQPAHADLIEDAWIGTTGQTGVKRERKDMLCVNPLTGTKDGSAPAETNPGTIVPTATMNEATLQPGLIGAHCENGLLLLDGKNPELGPFVLPGGNYHVYDYALFWAAIRNDAARRLKAWHR